MIHLKSEAFVTTNYSGPKRMRVWVRVRERESSSASMHEGSLDWVGLDWVYGGWMVAPSVYA